MKWGRALLRGYTMAFLAALYAPIAVLIALSFNESRLVYVWTGFSTRWYEQVFANPLYTSALLTSVIVALATTLLSIVFGTMAGIAAARITSPRVDLLWTSLVLLPLIMPEIVEALSLSLFYGAVGIRNGIGATILGHVVFSVSFVALIIRARMAGVGKAYEEASMVLGATRVQTFLKVLLPIALPAVTAGAFLAFAASFDDVVKSDFTTDATTRTLPIIIFAQAARGGVSPGLNALATVTVVISLAFAMIRNAAERRISQT